MGHKWIYAEDSFLTLKEISRSIIISAGFMVGAPTAWTTAELLNPLATAWLPLSWAGRHFGAFTSWDSRCIYFFVLFVYSCVFIYLTVPGLSCGVWDLVLWPRIGPRPPALGLLGSWPMNHQESPYIFKFSHKLCVSNGPYLWLSFPPHFLILTIWTFMELSNDQPPAKASFQISFRVTT